jgi:hypothetical protein
MDKDIVERLQMVADIEDASSIPPELLDNTVFRQIMKDAIATIKQLRTYNQMAAYTPVPTSITTTTTNPVWVQQWENQFATYATYANYPTTTVPTTIAPVSWQQIPTGVSPTMIYTKQQQKALADAAVQTVLEAAAKEDKPPPAQDEKDRLWDLVKSSVEGGG